MLRFRSLTSGLALMLCLISTSACDSDASSASPVVPTLGPEADGHCNRLSASPSVAIDTRAEVAPTPAGGTLPDGTYILVEATLYVGVGGDVSAASDDVSGVIDVSSSMATDGLEHVANFIIDGTTRTAKLSASGSTLSVASSCPAAATEDVEYTSTASSLVVFDKRGDGVLVETFRR